MKRLFFLPILILFIFSCKKEETNVPDVVINELMPVNSYTVMDQNNEFDDWVELYNNSSSKVDLSNYYLSDSRKNLTKWKFPEGTSIESKSFLIVWTDGDTIQVGLHANFKLSSGGEKFFLVNPDKKILDEVDYDEKTTEVSFSRVPNGTGDFQWKTPTFNAKN
jgi:hypothetical protein